MRIISGLLGLFWTSLVSANLVQPQHAALQQKAEVACWKFGNSYKLTFYLTANGDRIDNVYTVNSTDPSDTSVTTFSSRMDTLDGTGTTLDPYQFTVTGTVESPGTPITLDVSSHNARKAYVTEPDVISVSVMSKSRYEDEFYQHILFSGDVLYLATCNFTQVQDQIVTTGHVSVSGDVSETPYRIDDSAVMNVIAQDGVARTSVSITEKVSLEIQPIQSTHATGVFAHSCDICDHALCSGLVLPFIGVDGCSTSSLISGFSRSGTTTVTNQFNSFMFNNQNGIYFRCKVNYCYDPSDLRCDNYCTYNTVSGKRKKRQAADVIPSDSMPDRDVLTLLTITIDDQGVASANKQLQENTPSERLMFPLTNMTLMVAVITLASLLFVGLIAAAVVFYKITSKRNSSENSA